LIENAIKEIINASANMLLFQRVGSGITGVGKLK
jgi:hypothetical protein